MGCHEFFVGEVCELVKADGVVASAGFAEGVHVLQVLGEHTEAVRLLDHVLVGAPILGHPPLELLHHCMVRNATGGCRPSAAKDATDEKEEQ